jgi:hypothetical protein
MRIAILAAFLFAGTTTFGQSSPVGPLNPDHSGSPPSPWTAQSRDFSKLPPDWPATLNMPHWTVMEPLPPAPRVPLGDASIDPKIVAHPPHSRVGMQPPGAQIAQNLYPGLTFQPIGQLYGPGARPLSTVWPNLHIKDIPTVWPKFKIEPILAQCATCEAVSDSKRNRVEHLK